MPHMTISDQVTETNIACPPGVPRQPGLIDSKDGFLLVTVVCYCVVSTTGFEKPIRCGVGVNHQEILCPPTAQAGSGPPRGIHFRADGSLASKLDPAQVSRISAALAQLRGKFLRTSISLKAPLCRAPCNFTHVAMCAKPSSSDVFFRFPKTISALL
jgi:hypothetical protein